MPANKKSKDPVNYLDGDKVKKLFLGGLRELEEQQSLIDSLNVFPVPDGDTGTNMYLTYRDAVEEMRNVSSGKVGEIISALAEGALMGARGNSGVILSQLIRGFSLVNEGNEILDREDLVEALRKASEVAYNGVMKPVEGTILTVSRKAADGAELALENDLDIIGIMQSALSSARITLNKTPEMLQELKEAEVVDAGGQGYVTILEGMLKVLTGNSSVNDTIRSEKMQVLDFEGEEKKSDTGEVKELEHSYCTQVLINKKDIDKNNIDEIRSDLDNYGDSLMVVGSDRVIKIHIHTNHPGVILEYALKIGELNNIKIENMNKQAEEKRKKEKRKKEKHFNEENFQEDTDDVIEETDEGNSSEKKIGLISVVQGEGFKSIFKELGVDSIIDGGQSMNPSTNDFVEAIDLMECKNIIIFPNNKNIVSAAKQAASLSDKNVEVIPTSSIPQAVSSLIIIDGENEIEQAVELINSEINTVKTLEITRAVKDSQINGHKIEKGDIIGIAEGEIEVYGDTFQEVILKLINKMTVGEELLTIYYGQEISEEEAGKIKKLIESKTALEDIELIYGGQPLYPYIISAE